MDQSLKDGCDNRRLEHRKKFSLSFKETCGKLEDLSDVAEKSIVIALPSNFSVAPRCLRNQILFQKFFKEAFE